METNQVYGKYGTLAKIYLEEHEPGKCWALGKDLPDYLHGIDRQAGELYDVMYARLSAMDEFRRQPLQSLHCLFRKYRLKKAVKYRSMVNFAQEPICFAENSRVYLLTA